MKAVIITRPGNPDVLKVSDVDTPIPGPDQVFIRVYTTAVNRADLMQRRGNYPPPPGYRADIPGLEYAGVIEATGERVMGIIGGASYAEYVVVHRGETIPIPSGMSFEEAAAIPEAFLTAYDALHARLHLQPGETVLIHAVASGVGTAALQLAKQLGCVVIGTARSDEKLERAKLLGLDVGVNAASESFVDVVREQTEAGGVDAVVDLVGGDYLTGNLQALAMRGRMVVVGLVAGAVAPLDMRLLLNKRATIVGTVMRARSLEEKVQVTGDFTRNVIPLFQSGALVPIVDRVLSMDEVVSAHEIVERNENFGKIVLRW